MTLLLVALALIGGTCVAAFSPTITPFTTVVRPNSATTKLHESFGFDFADDAVVNTPDVILGEARYKDWVVTVADNSFLNRQYNVIRRIRELDLLKLTAEYRILAKLEKNGLDLATIETFLPLAEKLRLLSLVGNNQQLFINLLAPLLVEPAPLLIPAIAGALETGPPAFFGLAAALAGLEGYLVVSGAEVPYVGLSAGSVFGLILVPLAALSGGVGIALSNLKKTNL